METLSKITPLQETIIRMKAEGLMYKEIAVKLNYAETNCSNQVHYAKKKAGVKTLKELQNLLKIGI
jgi:DNA-binding NarL/FixJ family response regulator